MTSYSIEDLITLEKLVDGAKVARIYTCPAPGKSLEIRLMSPDDPARKFTLSVSEGSRSSQIALSIDAGRKTNIQTRHLSDPLVRVDINTKAIHSNPDGSIIRGSHVHIASEEYGDKMAYPVGSNEAMVVIGRSADIPDIFESFKKYCHIDPSLRIDWPLGV